MAELLESNRTRAPVSVASSKSLASTSSLDNHLPARFPEENAVGTAGGGGPDEFGVIVDAAVGSEGHVILLDESHGILRVFDTAGTPIQTLGGKGDGPGEFREPVSITVGPGDTILVADRAVLVHRFVRQGSDWAYSDRYRLDFSPNDLCSGGGRTFLNGQRATVEDGSHRLESSGSVHEATPGGKVIRSFATPYHSSSLLALMSLETARLSCDPAGDRLWIGYSPLGEVHAYTSEGTLLWITRLEGFENPGLLERNGGSIGAHPSAVSQVFEIVSHLSYLSAGLVLAEVESRPHLGSKDISRRVYVLDSSTGEGKGMVQGYGVIGGGSNWAVLYREDPFPQYAVVSVGGGQ